MSEYSDYVENLKETRTEIERLRDQKDNLSYQLTELWKTNEQQQVQLAAVSVAALGGTKDPAKQNDYGWSQPYQDTLELRLNYECQQGEIEALRNERITLEKKNKSLSAENEELNQVKSDASESIEMLLRRNTKLYNDVHELSEIIEQQSAALEKAREVLEQVDKYFTARNLGEQAEHLNKIVRLILAAIEELKK